MFFFFCVQANRGWRWRDGRVYFSMSLSKLSYIGENVKGDGSPVPDLSSEGTFFIFVAIQSQQRAFTHLENFSRTLEALK